MPMSIPSKDFRPTTSRSSYRLLLSALLVPLLMACGGAADVSGSVDPGDTGGSSSGAGTGTGGNIISIGSGGTDGAGGNAPEGECGNGIFEVGEICDDGNTEGGDGCSADCTELDPDYFCGEAGDPCVRVVTCGNGIIEGDEVCDDGNLIDDDGCSTDCSAVTPGYACIKPGEPCVLLPVCGNGLRERGEQCDDGQSPPQDGDGCDATCQLEPGFFCPPGQACIQQICGDGVRTPDEDCDDHNTIAGDGCTDCQVDPGWRCSASGCRPICGDGLINGDEECDDGVSPPQSGDGCSAACRIEPFFDCAGEPSVCTSNIVCGDGEVGPGEVCDPAIPGQEACYDSGPNACKGYDNALVDPPVCGNGIVELDEDCDGDGGTGGCVDCQVTPGFACPRANYCFRVPSCGDGLLQAGEDCDPGLSTSIGCDENCTTRDGYYCSGEPSVCVQSICGDGFRAPDEQCDDGPGTYEAPQTPVDGDGCSATCTVEPGWVCPPELDCQPKCGDGLVRGSEECDSPDEDACENCRLKPGFTCGVADGATNTCTATVCGNGDPNDPIGAAEPGEGCDDGNTIAGDGCGPTCQIEPDVTHAPGPNHHPTVLTTCGDGLITGDEQCDDGNKTSGDGCSATCEIEDGWICDDVVHYPDAIEFRVTYRDFKQRNHAGGHPHMKRSEIDPPASGKDLGITGAVCTASNTSSCGRLDPDGKPTYAEGSHPTIDHHTDRFSAAQHTEFFKLWYRDTNDASLAGANGVIDICPNAPLGSDCQGTPILDTLRLDRLDTTSAYRFSSGNFYPLGNNADPVTPGGPLPPARGYGHTESYERNFHFTSELRYFFQYQGGETLTFYGDDDVWVFINGRLAVDIGGIHAQLWGRVVLGDTDSDCSLQGTSSERLDDLIDCYTEDEQDAVGDDRFGLSKGGVYEIVVFQAERHPTGSNYQLTLDGFIAPRSSCHTECGDGVRAGTELCDDGAGMPASGYGVCKDDCTFEFCGDGHHASAHEACDDGVNATLYGDSGCAPGCELPDRCGDGIIQAAFGEVCDDGVNNGVHGGCAADCKSFGPYCGDGEVAPGLEDCDTPGDFTNYAAEPGACGFDCVWAGFCGDGVRNGPEICDDGALNGTAGSFCNTSCEFEPYCGDGVKTSDEQCDYGPFAFAGPPEDAPYGSCTDQCSWGPRCGDEVLHEEDGEECDDGEANSDTLYNGCTLECLYGPRCGDAILQSGHGEQCDNGFNEDDYEYPGSMDACGPNCTAVPYCGDNVVQSAYELCDHGADNDDNAYDGCTTSCEWGPYCGDGIPNGAEQCDDGPNNVAYSATGDGCSYECKTNVPYCGDGVRNGPEQCDLGTGANTGAYGTCNPDCTRAPRCGDGIVQSDDGEECDDGPSGSTDCTQACRQRTVIR